MVEQHFSVGNKKKNAFPIPSIMRWSQECIFDVNRFTGVSELNIAPELDQASAARWQEVGIERSCPNSKTTGVYI